MTREETFEMTPVSQEAARTSSVVSSNSSSTSSVNTSGGGHSSANGSATSPPSSLDVPMPGPAPETTPQPAEGTEPFSGNPTTDTESTILSSSIRSDSNAVPTGHEAQESVTDPHLWSMILQLMGQLRRPTSVERWLRKEWLILVSLITILATILGAIAGSYQAFSRPTPNWAQKRQLSVQIKALKSELAILREEKKAIAQGKQALHLERESYELERAQLEENKRVFDVQKKTFELANWRANFDYAHTCRARMV